MQNNNLAKIKQQLNKSLKIAIYRPKTNPPPPKKNLLKRKKTVCQHT